jgi:hypothetical protein
MSIESALARLERPIGAGERGFLCMCNGQIKEGKLFMVDAADDLARTKPETVCATCGNVLLLFIVVPTRSEDNK